MAIERLKFRCYRCNQLLGATPNKAGSIINCPKCSAELLIPVPELPVDEGSVIQERAPAPAPGPARAKVRAEPRPKPDLESSPPPQSTAAATAVGPISGSKPLADFGASSALEAGLPPDLIDLKPEDLRVEAEFFESLTRQPPAPAPVREPAPWPPPELIAASVEMVTQAQAPPSREPPVVAEPPVTRPALPAPPVFTQSVDLAAKVIEPAPPPLSARAETALIGTAIEIEHPPILPPATATRRVQEVILPASAVLAFSLFILLGIALSFIAGLLMGHFLWRTH